MPAAAVIPAPEAYTNVAVLRKLVAYCFCFVCFVVLCFVVQFYTRLFAKQFLFLFFEKEIVH